MGLKVLSEFILTCDHPSNVQECLLVEYDETNIKGILGSSKIFLERCVTEVTCQDNIFHERVIF